MRIWLTLMFVVTATLPAAIGSSDSPRPQGGFPEQAQPLPPQYDVPPKAIRVTRPELPRGFPEPATKKSVLLQILIDTRGRVVKATVTKSIPGLDQAALECVMNWRFRPALKDGLPIATCAQVAITFGGGPATDKI